MRGLTEDILGTITSAREEYGDIIRFPLGRRNIYAVCNPAAVQEVLVEKKDTFIKLSQIDRRNSVAIVLGNGLLSSHGEHWQRQRRMMQPLFHAARVRAMTKSIIEAGARLTDRWAALSGEAQNVDVLHEMSGVTLDVISQTMFGTAVDQRVSRIEKALSVASRYVFDRLRNPLMPPQSWPLRRNAEFREALRALDKTVTEIVSNRASATGEHGVLLDMLIDARDEETNAQMDAMQLRDEVATIFSAGHETTAAALAWSWYLLNAHSEIERRVTEEVDSVIGERRITADDFDRLKFTRAVFEEALRLYPPGPLVPRASARADTVGGYPVPAGAITLVSIYHVHRHADFWSAPEVFDPERFMDPEKRPPRNVYLPFSIGQRMCIGSHMAMVEGVLLIAQIAQRFTLRRDPQLAVAAEAAITLRPKGGLPMRVVPR